MPKRVLIIDGHPDALAERYLHALSTAYRDGAVSAGHEVRSIIVSELQFPILRTDKEFQSAAPPEQIRQCQELLTWAEHVVVLFPLWLGSMPALLKAFFEQLLRPGYSFSSTGDRGRSIRRLTGKSARVIVTMGMPAFLYRWYFRAHGLKALERNILGFCGIKPVRVSVIGMVGSMTPMARGHWLARVQELGRRVK